VGVNAGTKRQKLARRKRDEEALLFGCIAICVARRKTNPEKLLDHLVGAGGT